MATVDADKIPKSLREHDQWVLWKMALRGEGNAPTKVPFQTNGKAASSDKPQTWTSFSAVATVFVDGGYDGIGFEFSRDDPFCGIDLDGCRDPETGKLSDWAREIVLAMNTYAEVSPTGTGVKMFVRAKSPFPTGRKKELEYPKINAKTPGIEIYDWGRYFAVTGLRLKDQRPEPEERQEQLNTLIAKIFPNQPAKASPVDFRSQDAVVERARKYLAKMPPAISGHGGHNRTFHTACILVLGFELSQADALGLLHEYNQRCEPPWSDKELLHKVEQAAKQPGQRGYLRNASPERWTQIAVPQYQAPALKHEPRITTLVDAARQYVASIANGMTPLIELGIPDLDYAIAGGVEKGEMVIFAARPSHGKSAVALQCIHHWTANDMPCAIVSEEMSALALGKRTMQFASRVPQEHWIDLPDAIESDLDAYAEKHAKCVILEGCGTSEAAVEAVEKTIREHGVQCAVVDYAQLLRSAGKTRYEQITNTSIMLRQLASTQRIVLLVLCQLSRAIESRDSFTPMLSDLKDSGQLEQDADVIVGLCWPHRIDADENFNKFQFFVLKNRNRGINQVGVVCRFMPDRQMILQALSEEANARRSDGARPKTNLWAGEGDLPN